MALGLLTGAVGGIGNALLGGNKKKPKQKGEELASKITKSPAPKEKNPLAKGEKKFVAVAKTQAINPDKFFNKQEIEDQNEQLALKGETPIDKALEAVNKSIAALSKTLKDKGIFTRKDEKAKRDRRIKLGRAAAAIGGALMMPIKLGESLLKRTGFLDMMKNFLKNVLIGGILMWLLKNFEEIKKKVEEFIDLVKKVFEFLQPVLTFIWDALKGVVSLVWPIVENILGMPEADTAKQEQDIEEIEKNLDDTEKEEKSILAAVTDVLRGINDFISKKIEGFTGGDTSASSGGGGGGGGSGMVGGGAATFDVIASGEGDYNSVNRGNAGDTPGGAKSVFGKDLTDMTVGEVVSLQQSGQVFAVGKYQIIPKTMTGFLANSDIKMTDKFDATTQEKFKDYVINVKRPEVGRYLRGETDDPTEAGQALAREFASVGLQYGEAGRGRGSSRYAGSAGNAASISPEEITAALRRDRAAGSVPRAPAERQRTSEPSGSGSSKGTSEAPAERTRAQRGSGGSVIEYLTGDRSHPGYRADHGGGNYHEHIAFGSKAERDRAVSALRSAGIHVGSLNDGKHAPDSYHYTDQALDIPLYPNLQKFGLPDNREGEEKFSAMARDILSKAGFSGQGIGKGNSRAAEVSRNDSRSQSTTNLIKQSKPKPGPPIKVPIPKAPPIPTGAGGGGGRRLNSNGATRQQMSDASRRASINSTTFKNT